MGVWYLLTSSCCRLKNRARKTTRYSIPGILSPPPPPPPLHWTARAATRARTTYASRSSGQGVVTARAASTDGPRRARHAVRALRRSTDCHRRGIRLTGFLAGDRHGSQRTRTPERARSRAAEPPRPRRNSPRQRLPVGWRRSRRTAGHSAAHARVRTAEPRHLFRRSPDVGSPGREDLRTGALRPSTAPHGHASAEPARERHHQRPGNHRG